MDEIDRASAATERMLADSIGRVRRGLDVQGPDECEDCGALIEPRRRLAMPSATRCIACQQMDERRGRSGGR